MSGELVPFEKRKQQWKDRWFGFQRKTLEEYWELGRDLDAIMGPMIHGEKGPWLAEIGLSTTAASNMRRIAREIDISQLGKYAGYADAVKSLPPARPKEEPKADPQPESAADAPAEPDPPAREPDEILKAEGEAAMAEAAAEHEEQRDHEAEREEEEERRAIQGEHVDPADERWKAAERHRKDVQAVNEARRMRAAVMRTKVGIRDALLAIPRDGDGQAAIDDVLARFFGVARKQEDEC